MTKKVDISVRPPGRRVPPVADAWVGSDATSSAAGGKLKRLTIDLDPELHARFKARCAMRGTKMVAEVVAMISRSLDGEA